MAANGKYGNRIVWSIAVLVLFVAIGLAAFQPWAGLKRGPVVWTRHSANQETSAVAAYDQGDWKRAADLSRQSLKTNGDDLQLLRVYARASARLYCIGSPTVSGRTLDHLPPTRGLAGKRKRGPSKPSEVNDP